ncbi:MAG: hypothetical protein ACKOZW_13390 [Cyanobium sp.]
MIGTATDPLHPPGGSRARRERRSWRAWPLLLATCLVGCAEEPLPQRRLSHDDCLREVRMEAIAEALQRCDRVVAAFPRDPQPLNERFLLHSLRGDVDKACRDIAAAAKLAATLPADRLDPLLRNDLRLRAASCRP